MPTQDPGSKFSGYGASILKFQERPLGAAAFRASQAVIQAHRASGDLATKIGARPLHTVDGVSKVDHCF